MRAPALLKNSKSPADALPSAAHPSPTNWACLDAKPSWAFPCVQSMASSTVRSKSRVTTHPERNGECIYRPRWRAMRGRYARQSTHVHSVVGDAKDCMPAGLQAALLFFQRRIPPRLLQRKRPQSASLLSALRTPHPFRDVFQTSIPAAKPSQCVRLRLSLVTTFRTFEHESVLTKVITQFVDMKSGRHT